MKSINVLPPKEEFMVETNAMEDFQNETIRTNNILSFKEAMAEWNMPCVP